MSTETQQTGSCACGKITARITGEPDKAAVCYCTPCQKSSGCALATNTFWPKTAAEWSDPEGLLRTYVDHDTVLGKPLRRGFCGHCGSRVRTLPASDEADWVVIPMGFLDGDNSPFRPEVEIFVKRRPDWVAGFAEGEKANFEHLVHS